MADFLELIETFKAQEASTERLLGGEGDTAGSRASALRRTNPRYVDAVTETISIFEAAARSRTNSWERYKLSEAMTTSDFPVLFADILDRQMLGKYQTVPKSWEAVCLRKTVNDFRTVKRFPYLYGGTSPMGVIPINANYTEDKITDTTAITYAVQKYGRRIPFGFETIINDDLDALKDVPDRFATAAAMTEEQFATKLYCGVNGPDITLYTDAHKNIMSVAAGATNANPVLSIAALQDAYKMISLQVDPDGNPIYINDVILVVPPALEITARNILNADQLWLLGAEAGATANQTLHVANWMRNKTSIVVNPWIPLVATSANGATSWWLFAAPAAGSAALEMGFLRGYENPQVFMKSPNAQMVGGGMANVMDGDFDTDSIQYKVRHILGGTQLLYPLTLASTGAAA